MDKQQVITYIEDHLATGIISKDDLLTLAHDHVAPPKIIQKEESSKNLINVFYAIGAIIVLVGVVILVGQNWDTIGFAGRVVVTLGISLATYISAFLLNKDSQNVISKVMFTISAALAPLGVYVLLNQANIGFAWPYSFYTACILGVIFGCALWATKKNILVLITIAYGSWAYCALISKMFVFDYNSDLLKWAAMFLGFAYILIAYGYRGVSVAGDVSDDKEKKAVRNILYGLGTLAVLGAGIAIGGIFDLVFIAFIFAAFYGSVYLKSRSMLTFAALFLMGHIVKLTSKYFVDSIGWPIALIIVGFLIIGVGYGAYSLNKKYIATR